MADVVRTADEDTLAQRTDLVRTRLHEHVEVTQRVLKGQLPEQLAEVTVRISAAVRAGGKVIFFGNGGSNADASHLAAELVGRMRLERPAIAALSLGDHNSLLTAVGNDYGFTEVFARGIEAFGRPGDVAVALTTSGRSSNVLRALAVAHERRLITVVLTGDNGAPLVADFVIRVPATDTQRIQEATMHLGHTLCELVEAGLCPARE